MERVLAVGAKSLKEQTKTLILFATVDINSLALKQ